MDSLTADAGERRLSPLPLSFDRHGRGYEVDAGQGRLSRHSQTALNTKLGKDGSERAQDPKE